MYNYWNLYLNLKIPPNANLHNSLKIGQIKMIRTNLDNPS